jgi:hypothetical protein
MYEDCIEKFSCNRYPNGCSEECYRVEEVIKTPNCETQIIFGDNSTVTPPIEQHKCPPEPMEDICPEHHCHEQERVIPQLVVVEGAPGKNGLNGKDLEFQWVYTDTEIRLGVRVKGTETWYYSPSLIGPQGPRGFKGEAGDTPYVGPGGTWWIGQTNTGVDAKSGYELPIASKEVLGGIKLGGDLEVTEDGTLNIVFPEVINDYTIPKVGESHVVQTLFGNYTITTTADKTISITDPKGAIAENIVLTQDTFTFDNLYALLMTQIQLMNAKLDNVAKEVIDNLAIKTLNASEENKIDFDTLIEPQFYIIKNATTNTCINGPALGSSGTIILEVGTKNDVVYQSVMTNTNNGLPYHRQLSSGAWSSWLSTIATSVIRAGILNTGMACNTPTADNHITNKKYVDEGLAQTIPNTVVGNIVALTQEAYDELETKNPKTLYLIVEELEEVLKTGNIFPTTWNEEIVGTKYSSDSGYILEASGTVDASSYSANLACDENISSRWQSERGTENSTVWLMITCPKAIKITKMKTKIGADGEKSSVIQGSKNGSTWVDLYNLESRQTELTEISLNNSDFYTYYKILLTIKANTYMGNVYEWQTSEYIEEVI